MLQEIKHPGLNENSSDLIDSILRRGHFPAVPRRGSSVSPRAEGAEVPAGSSDRVAAAAAPLPFQSPFRSLSK